MALFRAQFSNHLKFTSNYYLKHNYCKKLNNNTKTKSLRGIVLGINYNETPKLTKFAQNYNDSITNGKLLKEIELSGSPIKSGESRIFWNIAEGSYPAVCVTGLGDPTNDWDETDEINGIKENIRIAAAIGAQCLLNEGITNIYVEDMNCGQSAAEGAILGTYKYQAYKSNDKKTPRPTIYYANETDQTQSNEWQKGLILATAQNWARCLMETPANLMTPTIFSQNVMKMVNDQIENIECVAHDKSWIKAQKMGSFLSVANGTVEPPIFLEITYNGNKNKQQKPICLIGKGITFDSGGISIKPAANMDLMRADMGGAACVAATIYAIAKMKLPINIKGLMPLTENLPSGMANKPGDVVFAMNGKSICIDNTDCEGRLVLCDALCYSEKFQPKYIIDVATLTGAIKTSLGDCVAGVFTNDNRLWELAHKAGSETGDRCWRLPLFSHYSNEISTKFGGFDITNLGNRSKEGGSCKAAAFLHEFVPKNVPWIHFDTYGILGDCTDQPYLGEKGMSGRPMRTIFELICNEINGACKLN